MVNEQWTCPECGSDESAITTVDRVDSMRYDDGMMIESDPDLCCRVGFTGTQRGMTAKQKFEVTRLLDELCPSEVHHGDCVGADEELHEIADNLTCWIIVHPPNSDVKRAFCTGSEELPPRPYLHRNEDIVNSVDVLIACPATAHEVKRSGTWTTIRHARKIGLRVEVIAP